MNKDQKQTLSKIYYRKRFFAYVKTGIYNLIHNRYIAIAAVLYAIALIIVWHNRIAIFGLYTEHFETLLNTIFSFAYIITVMLITPILLFFLGMPKGCFDILTGFQKIGFLNHAGEPPLLLKITKDKTNSKIDILEFETCGLPLKEWENKKSELSSAMNIHVVKIIQGHDNQHILLYTVPATLQLPTELMWKDKFIENSLSVLVLGESLLGRVKIDLSNIPHMLVGGTTGSGKSILIKNLIYQAIKKNAKVIIADFKGVDFGRSWQQHCDVIIDEKLFIEALKAVVLEMDERKKVLTAADIPNIFEYNHKIGNTYNHIIIAVDEISQLLDKTNATKDRKEIIAEIEYYLATIARQGRAFGINLIIGTQRPDASILGGQIKNNIDCRICGRAETVLSQIILDCSDAADLIPKDAKGRFLLNDGTVFQGYFFDETELSHISNFGF